MPSDASNGGVKHNSYSLFVQKENDLVGHIAYALYKREKLQFIENILKEKGRSPNEDEFAAFFTLTSFATRIDALRTQSEQMLEAFAEQMIEEIYEKQVAEFDGRLLAELTRRDSFLRATAQNLLANLLAICVVALLAVIVYGSRIGLPQVMGDALGYEVREKVPPSATPPADSRPSGQP